MMTPEKRTARNVYAVTRWIDAANAEIAATRRDDTKRFDYLVARELRSELSYFAKQAKAGALDALEVLRTAKEIRRSVLGTDGLGVDGADELDVAIKIEVAAQVASLADWIA